MFRSSYEIEKIAKIHCDEIRDEIGTLEQIVQIRNHNVSGKLSLSEKISYMLVSRGIFGNKGSRVRS